MGKETFFEKWILIIWLKNYMIPLPMAFLPTLWLIHVNDSMAYWRIFSSFITRKKCHVDFYRKKSSWEFFTLRRMTLCNLIFVYFCVFRNIWCHGFGRKVYMLDHWNWYLGRFWSIIRCHCGGIGICSSSYYGPSIYTRCKLELNLIYSSHGLSCTVLPKAFIACLVMLKA